MRSKLRAGFTVIELFIVIIVMAIVATGINSLSNRSSATAAADQAARFMSAYQAVRSDAIAQGRYVLVSIRTDTAADRAAGRSAQYTTALVTDPNASLAMFAQASWTPVNEDVILDPGSVSSNPLPGQAVGVGFSRSTFVCRTTCDMGGSSAVTVYFRPFDDPLAVWAVVISQSGQARMFRYFPTTDGSSPWQ